MTSREDYIFQNIVERHNSLVITLQLVLTERDTLLQENNLMKEELGKAYRELAIYKGSAPNSPGLEDLAKHLEMPELSML